MSTLFLKIYHFFENKRLLLALLLIALLALGFFALLRLKLEEDITNVLPKDGNLVKYEHLLEKSSTGNKLIFILKDENKNIDQLSDAALALQNSLENDLPDSLVTSFNLLNDESVFFSLLNDIYNKPFLYLEQEDLAELNLEENVLREKIHNKLKLLFTPAGSIMKQSVLADPLDLSSKSLKNLQTLQFDNNFTIINSCLISKDSTYLLGFVKLSASVNKAGQKKLLKDLVYKNIELINKEGKVQCYTFGASIISEENAQRIKKDIMLTVNIAVGLLLLFLAYYFRTLKIIPGFLIPILLGSSVALIILYLQQDYVSAISLGMGSVLLGTIIDYSLHIFTHLKLGGNVENTIKTTSAPIIAGSITSSLSFLCLLLIHSKALSDLAIFAAASMFFGAVFAIIVLPQVYNNSFKPEQENKNFLYPYLSYNFHKNKVLLGICFLSIVLAIFFVRKIAFTKDLNELNYMPKNIQEAEIELNKASNTLQSSLLIVIEKTDLDETLVTGEMIEKSLLSKIQDSIVYEIKSAAPLLLSREKESEKILAWKNYWTNEKLTLVERILYEEANVLGIQESAFLPFISNLQNPQERSETSLSALTDNFVSYDESSGTYLYSIVVKLDIKHKNEIRALVEAIDTDISVIDKSNMIEGLVLEVKNSLNQISLILLILILIILGLYFRSIELVLLAITPVFLSWVTTLGLMGLFGISFNMLNIIIVIFIFGLGIDYAIFILDSLIHDYRDKSEQFTVVKTAVFLSALTTFVGIGVLYFAKHPALHSIAISGLIAIFSVFLYSIVLLPFLFHLFVIKRAKNNFEPITLSSLYDTFLAYSSLVFGVFVVSLVGIILKLFFFIPEEKIKNYFHQVFNFWARVYVKILYPKNQFTFENSSNEAFKKPSIIISNHQSLIDTPIISSLYPKTILLTKDWVRNSPLFGIGSRLADFYSVSEDQEELINKLKIMVSMGYSIAVFPEGTRSTSKDLIRFYRGAFYLAHQLELDIVPFFIFGSIDTLHKNQFIGQRRQLHLRILPRILFTDASFGVSNIERYKTIREFYKSKYYELRKEVENGNYFSKILLASFRYKGHGLFNQAKQNLKDFDNFEKIIPLLKNDKTTLIIDDSIGELCILQSFLAPHKAVQIIAKEKTLVRQHYTISSKFSFHLNLEEIDKNIEQIICISKNENHSNAVKEHDFKNVTFVFINLRTKSIEVSEI